MIVVLCSRVTGPLEPYALGFAAELTRLGYTAHSATGQVGVVAHLSRWMASERLVVEDLVEPVVERYMAVRRAAGYTNYRTAKALVPLLGYLRGLGAAPPPSAPVVLTAVGELLARYHRYLIVERGLGGPTAHGYLDAVRPFLAGRAGQEGGLELAGLTAADVTAFVLAACPGRAIGPAKLTVTALRSLLGFLHVEGVLAVPLGEAVPSVAGWRLSGLPRALEAEQVDRLLEAGDRRHAAGRRDLAILLLLVRLGLRAGEVAALNLDDIDWRAGELTVTGKGGRRDRLPVPADVGEMLADYCQRGRPPTTSRTLFVHGRAPFGPLSSGAVGHIVARAGERAGLGRIGAHRLRHTAASAMRRAGAPMFEIGQVLRHRFVVTTAIYAKDDLDALAGIARPWPGATT